LKNYLYELLKSSPCFGFPSGLRFGFSNRFPISIKILLIALVLPLFLQTGKAWAGVVEIPSDGVQRVILKGWDANVVVNPQASARTLRITGVDDSLSPGLYIVERKGNQIEIHMNEWTSKNDWKGQLGKQKNHHALELSGAPVALDIYLKDGQVHLSKLSKDTKVVLISGKVTSIDSQAPLEVFVHQGEINIQNQTGKLKIDQYQGVTTIKNLQADLELSAFNTIVDIEKSHGLLALNTQNSATKILGSSGTLQLDNGKGVITAQQFQGRVEGSTQEGALNLNLQAESEVHLRSLSGRVQVQLPPASGAALNLVSNEGEILVPENLKINRSATEKSFRGKLRGESQKDVVTVRSQEGSIVIK
jgi:hypothetical protein